MWESDYAETLVRIGFAELFWGNRGFKPFDRARDVEVGYGDYAKLLFNNSGWIGKL